MPRVSEFFGIVIRMYWNEAAHHRPHFHAEHGDDMASIAFDGEVLGGELPSRSLKLVREWAALHQEELTANWDRAQSLEPLEAIEPLA